MNHRNYRRERLTAIRRHIASKFLSPVSFALRTLPLKVKRTKERDCNERDSRSAAGSPRNEVSGVHLLREHVAAEGDAAPQGNRGKIGALSAFRFRPGPQ